MWKVQSGAGTKVLYVKSESLLAINPVLILELFLLPAHLQDISEASFTPRSTNNKWQR